ncbi:hypothetical protein ILYODFUR_034184 [Ilyodon furcidens]|uniref:C2H2-type domain-containing protein n=1 Tax=Ilyodon furcidens TaxID=33524 RepID=A0ABV0ST54_9TELE
MWKTANLSSLHFLKTNNRFSSSALELTYHFLYLLCVWCHHLTGNFTGHVSVHNQQGHKNLACMQASADINWITRQQELADFQLDQKSKIQSFPSSECTILTRYQVLLIPIPFIVKIMTNYD